MREKDLIKSQQYLETISIMKSFICDMVDAGGKITAERISQLKQTDQEYYAALLYLIYELKDKDFRNKVETIIPKSYQNSYRNSNPDRLSALISDVMSTDTAEYLNAMSFLRNLYEKDSELLKETIGGTYRCDNPINAIEEDDTTVEDDSSVVEEDYEEKQKHIADYKEDLASNVSISDISILSAAAEQFFPYEERKKQIADFLDGERDVRSIANLPSFIEQGMRAVMKDNPDVYFVLKGSSSRKRKPTDLRDPVDFDLEVVIPEVSGWTEEKRNALIARFITDIREAKQDIANSKSLFSLNISDKELGLDLSIYDATKMPDPDKSWSTSEDSKIKFFSDGRVEFIKPPEGASRSGFYVNPKARDLTSRIAFVRTLNPAYITRNKICVALQDLSPQNPIDNFYIEFLYGQKKVWEGNGEVIDEDKYLRNKVDEFCQKHEFDDMLRKKFIRNLVVILDTHNTEFINPRLIPQYQGIYKAIDEMVAETYRSEPSASLDVREARNMTGKMPDSDRGSEAKLL
ncbi:MAG: hypothetical protein KGQ36_01460 [Rickettsiales bacterium]|nr:hypothetical protein [Rickettsiales bacterium]